MPKRNALDGEAPNLPDSEVALTRIANLLGLLLTKGESEAEKVGTLASAGFSVPEIAALLGKTPNTVRVTLHKARRRAPGGSKRKARR